MSSSIQGTNWQRILLMAGGAAAVAGLLYYMRSEGGDEDKWPSSGKSSKSRKSHTEFSKNDVLAILRDITESQEKMKEIMKELTQELIHNKLSFEATCERVKRVQPEDPLERHQISMQEFDMILERYQNDSAVREAITTIMGAPTATTTISESARNVTKDQIINLHEFMLTELKNLVEYFDTLDTTKFEMKTVTIAAQAVVGSKVEDEFGLNSEDIESAVLLHHQSLTSDPNFARINTQMQVAMSHLMGYGAGVTDSAPAQ